MKKTNDQRYYGEERNESLKHTHMQWYRCAYNCFVGRENEKNEINRQLMLMLISNTICEYWIWRNEIITTFLFNECEKNCNNAIASMCWLRYKWSQLGSAAICTAGVLSVQFLGTQHIEGETRKYLWFLSLRKNGFLF